ncbi:glycosyltransferase [Candidatus Dojkabacteria bacterium]|jgi:glycosyltransferase involved in cell wall biosynthesis|nr:glycosyltransferase [Candidatus Dojkabacteria bacterium]
MVKNRRKIKVAIVTELLYSARGSERVVDTLCEVFPTAKVFALCGNKNGIKELKNIKKENLSFSFLQKFPLISKLYRYTYFLWPLAIEQFDLANFDLVISVSFAVAKGVITGVNTTHISYINSPMKYIWDLKDEYYKSHKFALWKRLIIPFFLNYIRIWDIESNSRIDYMIANSAFVSKRIQKYWGMNADKIVYPPVDIQHAINSKTKSDYYYYHGALEPNKGVLELVKSAITYDFNLKISGAGTLLKKIKKIIKGYNNVEVLGWVTDNEKWKLYSRAKAFLFPSIEDFGIVSVEAQACGTPVIALNSGGGGETVIGGVTGVLIEKQTAEDIWEGIQRLNRIKIDKKILINNSSKYSKEIFKKEINRIVEDKIPF